MGLNIIKRVLVIIILSLLSNYVLSQTGTLDTLFNTKEFKGFNGGVYSFDYQSDGKIIVGGYFTTCNDTVFNRLVRLNSDYTIDHSFNLGSGFDNSVRTIAIQPDGKIIVGGDFNNFNGVSASKIIRLNTDGSVDNSFSSLGFNNTVQKIIVQFDDKIIVSGLFTSYNNVPCDKLIRIENNGNYDNSFSMFYGQLAEITEVTAMSILGDNKILTGLKIYNTNQFNYSYVLCKNNLDGSLDDSFNLIGVNAPILAIKEQLDGKVIIGGEFTTITNLNIQVNRIFRINVNGSTDGSFNIGTGLNNKCTALEIQNDGKIIVGGDFSTFNNQNCNKIVRLNLNGGQDLSFENYTLLFINRIFDIKVNSNNKILFVGIFNDTLHTLIHNFAVLDNNGKIDNSKFRFNSYVKMIKVQNDGKILVSGDFSRYNSYKYKKIIRLNIDGTIDNSFNTNLFSLNTSEQLGSGEFIIEILNDGKILFGGSNLVRLNNDGTVDPNFNNVPFNFSINCIAIQNDGKILVGGNFTTWNLQCAKGIIRLNENGTRDNSFTSELYSNCGFFGNVNDIKIQADGKILVGGTFTGYKGQVVNKICRINPDGSLDQTFNSGDLFVSDANYVKKIFIQNDNKILVGTTDNYDYNDALEKSIIRLNSDGSIDPTFFVGMGFDSTVTSIALTHNNKILIGGYFRNYDNNPANRIISLNLDGSIDNTFTSDLGFDSDVNDIYITTIGKLYIGGAFKNYNGINRNRIACLNVECEPYYTTINEISCVSYTWIDGNTYNSSTNSPTYSISNGAGCDEILNLNLTILNPTFSNTFITSCENYYWNNNLYASSGTYIANLINSQGCDSIATLNLTILEPSSSVETISNCVSYEWNGNTYSNSGTYTENFINVDGCDSTATLNLTILQPTNSSETISVCDSYTWNGNTYNSSGSYTATLVNAQGCDSICTLNLSILQPTNSTETVSSCENYTWNGFTYNSSGTYTATLTNSNGCDSIVTLNLTINEPTSGSELISTCSSYSWNGNTYSSSGTYTANLVNSNGCDSLATLNLTILESTTGSETVENCENYTWQGTTYNSSGTYTTTLTNSNGCDSIVTLNLTINPLPSVNLPNLGSYCDTLEAFALTGGTPNGGVYSGTSVNANNFDPSIGEGTYTITYSFTDGNGCSNTVDATIEVIECINTNGIKEQTSKQFTLSPNPTSSTLNIKFNTPLQNENLYIYSVSGQKLIEKKVNGTTETIAVFKFSKGIYFLEIGSVREKFVVE